MPIPNVKRMTDKFICLMAFSFGEVAEKLVYVGKLSLSYIDVAISFYQKIGLSLAHYIKERKVAFFWIGDANKKEQMLGVWEVPVEKWRGNHFALHIPLDDMKNIKEWMESRGILPKKEFGKEPIVHTWMPAASIYFDDPDGNSLEFISILPHEPRPELDVMYLSEWYALHE
ncbi:VOC family protein [Thermolongibacillus altinsuensis]|uniref:VOC family protein n=1 Tax=Thermolongibacillus altinsuensis TaxID=575256 RepID=UPI00255602AA|nr:VOC family protein [Thermolongibacillus altinsuensis]